MRQRDGLGDRMRSARGLTILVSALALVVAGCTSQQVATSEVVSSTVTPSAGASPSPTETPMPTAAPSPTATRSVSVGSDGSATVTSQGYGVHLAASAATGGRLRLTPSSIGEVPGFESAPFVRLGPAMDVELDGGKLTGSATVTLPVPGATPAASNLMVVWQDGQGGWQALPTIRSVDAVTAQSPRLGWGYLATVEARAVPSQAKKAFQQLIRGRIHGDKPDCPGQQQVLDAQLVRGQNYRNSWCLGFAHGQRVLKITNTARTFQQVTYPSEWSVKAGGSTAVGLGPLAHALGREPSLPSGMDGLVLASGDTVVFSIPSTSRGLAYVSPSWVTWALSAIVFGAGQYGTVADSVNSPLTGDGQLAADPAGFLGIGPGSKLDVLKPCAASLAGVKSKFTMPVESAILHAAFACVPDVVQTRLHLVPGSDESLLATAVSASAADVLSTVGSQYTAKRHLNLYAPRGPETALWYGAFVFASDVSALSLDLKTGWAGVTPGDDIDQVASSLGLTVTHGSAANGIPSSLVVPRGYPSVITDAPQNGVGGTTVSLLTVTDAHVVGPEGLKVGDLASDYPGLTSGSALVKQFGKKKSAGQEEWVLDTGQGWYFWMVAAKSSGTVTEFGLSASVSAAKMSNSEDC